MPTIQTEKSESKEVDIPKTKDINDVLISFIYKKLPKLV